MGASGRCANLDSGVNGVADNVGLGLPGAESHRGDLGAGVEHEAPHHILLTQTHWPMAVSSHAQHEIGARWDWNTGRPAALAAHDTSTEQRRAVQWLPSSLVPSAGFDRHLRRHRNFIGETLSSLS